MLRGFATVNFFADDLIAARDWYADLFGIDAYFQRPDEENPAYIEFRVGDYEDELGIIHRRYEPHHGEYRPDSPGGAVADRHVDDLEGGGEGTGSARGVQRNTSRSLERGEGGFVTASVVDPFGNSPPRLCTTRTTWRFAAR